MQPKPLIEAGIHFNRILEKTVIPLGGDGAQWILISKHAGATSKRRVSRKVLNAKVTQCSVCSRAKGTWP